MAGKLTLSTGQNSSSASPTNGVSLAFLDSTVDDMASLTDSEFMYTKEEDINSMVTESIRKIPLDGVLPTPLGWYLMLSSQSPDVIPLSRVLLSFKW